ncbi:MAG: diaminopimelate epimerase [Bacteroidota bacterium]
MQFSKYHGAGNDFILIDGRQHWPTAIDDYEFIAHLCHRRFGIGADGLIVLTNLEGCDFEMHYYNSDGRPSSMCGNGGRCIVAFASALGINPASADGLYHFMAVDGLHRAKIAENGMVELEMQPVQDLESIDDDFILDTGSPHYVRLVGEVDEVKIIPEAHEVRYGKRFAADGINVNFVEQLSSGGLSIRTYERGVEDETYACGTGVVAASIVRASQLGPGKHHISVSAKGGELKVDLEWDGQQAKEIWLKGGAKKVFTGFLDIG